MQRVASFKTARGAGQPAHAFARPSPQLPWCSRLFSIRNSNARSNDAFARLLYTFAMIFHSAAQMPRRRMRKTAALLFCSFVALGAQSAIMPNRRPSATAAFCRGCTCRTPSRACHTLHSTCSNQSHLSSNLGQRLSSKPSYSASSSTHSPSARDNNCPLPTSCPASLPLPLLAAAQQALKCRPCANIPRTSGSGRDKSLSRSC